MKKKRAVVLGAGISGLVAAHALKRTHEVTVLEKSASLGGAMQAVEKEGFFFECGPRTFRTKGSSRLLALAHELGLHSRIIGSSPQAKKRYILFQKELHQTPSSPFDLFTSPLCRGLRKDLLLEWRRPQNDADESIFDFAHRRFGQAAASRFFDPLALGIFGCDARRVSIRSAFPILKEWEMRYGSITAGLFRSKRPSSKPLIDAPLFSFQKGTAQLVEALNYDNIHLEEEAIALDEGIVKTAKGEYPADSMISALPPHAIGRLLTHMAPEISSLLLSIPMAHLTVVHLGYMGSLLSHSGFGYLVPTSEQEKVMGVVFDSEIFPEHNRGEQTRLTVMLHGQACLEDALSALKRHLGINQSPDVVHIHEQSLPIMEVGHQDKITSIQNVLKQRFPNFHLIGNYLSGPSVENCICRAMKSTG